MVRNAFPSKNEKNSTCADHFWTFRYCFAWEARRIVHRVTQTRERGRLVHFVAFQKTMAGAGRLKRNRKVMRRQVPAAAAAMLHMLANPAQAPPNIQAAHSARQTIQEHGWDAPTWHQLVELRPPTPHGNLVAGPIQPEWQQQAATLSTTQHATGLYNILDPASQAMLDPQAGPFASRAFTTIPYNAETTYPDHLFRILLLRRLRLPLPFTERSCRCRRILDPYGDHRSACARAGVRRG